jgi:nucleosome binding factor SPN SPT16 subunit
MSRQDPKFDKEQFWTRVHALYASWNSSPKIWRDQDAFVLLSGKQDENILYQRTLALFLWLTGYELFETLVVFTEKSIYVVASSKKSSSVALAHLM